jgi:hypothetical protein
MILQQLFCFADYEERANHVLTGLSGKYMHLTVCATISSFARQSPDVVSLCGPLCTQCNLIYCWHPSADDHFALVFACSKVGWLCAAQTVYVFLSDGVVLFRVTKSNQHSPGCRMSLR